MCYSLMVEQDLKKLSQTFGAHPHETAFAGYTKLASRDPKRFKSLMDHARIYPNYFAPVVVQDQKERLIFPMRYRVRPHHSAQEIPSKYNVFNARLDALETRDTWRQLFMKRHGVVGVQAFFEWVTDDQGHKKVVQFAPDDHSLLWVPVLWDTWKAADGSEGFASFAVITTTPPPEVEAAGHDRCPILLDHEKLALWLDPAHTSKNEIYQILEKRWDAHFTCLPATP